MNCKNCGHPITVREFFGIRGYTHKYRLPALIVKIFFLNCYWRCLCGCKNPEPKQSKKQAGEK